MSAFALRKRLLESQDESSSPGTSPSPVVSAINDTNPPQAARSPRKTGSRQKRARKDGQQGQVQEAALQLVPPLGSTISVVNQTQPLGQDDLDGVNTPPLETVPTVQEPAQPATILSTYSPSKANYRRHKDGTTVITFCEGERLVILGNYGIRLRSGRITINGAALGPESSIAWVDAPQCYALPVMRAVDDAVVELHSHLANKPVRHLASISPMFRGLWLDDAGSTFKIVKTSSDGPKRTLLQDLVSPPEWNREIARISKAASPDRSTIMVTGPKSSGKSTFGKMLANRIISEMSLGRSGFRSRTGLAILDLDPGQPEYGGPGQISLVHIQGPVLGPSFTRPIPLQAIQTIRAHTLASISPASDPELYLEAANDLYTHYRNTLGSSSLIINTPGWIQGTGLDLLVSLIGDLRPSEVVYMSQTGPSDTVEGLSIACKNVTFTMLPSSTTSLAARSAAQLRSMQLMSYFHVEHNGDNKALNKASNSPGTKAPYCWISTPLTHVPPWEVGYGPQEGSGIAGIICYDYQAPPALLADAINGNILAIVEVEDVRAFREITATEDDSLTSGNVETNNVPASEMDIDPPSTSSPLQTLIKSLVYPTPEGLPLLDTRGATLDPQYSRFIGLALVRGIDKASQTLQLITPVSSSELDRAFTAEEGHKLVLVSGKFDTPSWAYTEDFYHHAAAQRRDTGGKATAGATTSNVASGDDSDEHGDQGSDEELEDTVTPTNTPWIEELKGSQKRGIASKVWRVRRDLGRSNNAGD
ncbi:uncharacterized protein B0I36DRAFT_290595 [Microdochium trichocladiopsis]|uniref:Polynucleotide 5'-hydroxyl-kinase GRC3 n=1 Tax=Microdochium trichocladiopsis TaxID=1682393 RepID=A0A9P8Y6W4_9PEZI|nr:uncharacterized protein B0I36DRAFT_290595 [Microdochium trichocladiopsis]KAH7029167.1 hypothetical protein B0I36DRAFT_290595 [Microdochium trichocladiopsis]